MIIINEIMVFTQIINCIYFFINCIYCIVLIVYIVLARTCFNERFSLLNVAWLNKVLYCIVLLREIMRNSSTVGGHVRFQKIFM